MGIDINSSETGYRRVSVLDVEPERLINELKDKFYVEEENEDELVLIAEDRDSQVPGSEVLEYLQEEAEDYVVSSQGIKFESDLPQEFRDTEKEDLEEYLSKPQTGSFDEDEVRAILNCSAIVREMEVDHDHLKILDSMDGRVKEMGENVDSISGEPSKEDVELALSALAREGVYRSFGGNHDNNVLLDGREFIELYMGGELPKVEDYIHIR